ncbi:putative dipeptidyl-peptidase 5, variant 2 [Arthrobotrys musiformis]|uniref:Dipeptidyl-peptidase V n=1 Tax=Arthrobotrys musiformis TaxID=47236 RepID=A0AAV9WKU1_9PEZI
MTFGIRELLGSARLSSAVPNPAGTLALFSSSAYSFDKHDSEKGHHVFDITVPDGQVTKLWDDKTIGEVAWLGIGDYLGYLKTNGTKSELWTAKVGTDGVQEVQKVYEFPGEVSNLKFQAAGETVYFVVSAPAFKDGSIYSADTAPKKHSSGRVYTSLFVRHWDEWISEYKSNLFSGIIARGTTGDFEVIGKLTNLLHGTELESPVGPFGGTGDFDISPDGKHVIFLSKAPKLDLAQNTATYVYAVPFTGGSEPKAINPHNGATISPRFSPDGSKVVYLQMRENGYEADKNEIFVTEFTSDYKFVITQVAKTWDRSPGSVTWSANNNYLYLIGEDHGREKVWTLPIISSIHGESRPNLDPTPITSEFSANELYVIGDSEKLLVSITSLTSPTFYAIISATDGKTQDLTSPLLKLNQITSTPERGTWHGLSRAQVSDFYYPGAGGFKVHAWIVKPSTFDPSKKYPLLFLIHGGPQGAWNDAWSYRWNPAVMAEQGYVVVAFNPTGSTGYGKEFTDRIQDHWGGRPFRDLELGFEYLEKHFDYIDTKNAIAAGASYGGYMINWIAGQPFAKKFRTLVCHDGIFNTLNMYATEELWFIDHDFKGQIFHHREHFERWNPLGNVKHWSVPMMIIHSSKDYRIPISEALAAFNVLQIKGIKSKFLTFPDENHWVLKPENSLVWHREVFNWMREFSGVGGDSAGEEEVGEAVGEAKGLTGVKMSSEMGQDILRDE